jgi:pimeloyl-ACP methyl ester carboxylesterase
VLLHCSASSSRQWRELVEALQPRFQVFAIDLHDHGAQRAWQGAAPMTLADEAALAEACMAQADEVHLVGHSYGAVVATKLALLHPQRVRSLVAYEPVLLSWLIDDDACAPAARELLATAALVRAGVLRGRADEAAWHFVDYWSGAGAWGSLCAAQRDALAARMPAIARHFDALSVERLHLAPLAERGLPSLWLCGGATVAATRRIAQMLRLTLPGALHETLPGLDHMAPVTHAQRFNARTLQFLCAHACL